MGIWGWWTETFPFWNPKSVESRSWAIFRKDELSMKINELKKISESTSNSSKVEFRIPYFDHLNDYLMD